MVFTVVVAVVAFVGGAFAQFKFDFMKKAEVKAVENQVKAAVAPVVAKVEAEVAKVETKVEGK